MALKIRENIKELVEFSKINTSLYSVRYEDKLVYDQLDLLMVELGEIEKYSSSVNNILSEHLLKRIICDLYIEKYGEASIKEEEVINIEHINRLTNSKVFFTISIIRGKEWGKGIIYSYRDSSTI